MNPLFIICGGTFCPHFLCSNFIVILFRFHISKNGGCKMEPFLNPGGAFRPQIVKVEALSAPTQDMLLKYCLDLSYIQTGNCRFLYIDKVQFISRFIIFSSSKLPTCFVSKNISLFITTIIIAAITTKIVCIHFVSGVMFIFSCIIFINK